LPQRRAAPPGPPRAAPAALADAVSAEAAAARAGPRHPLIITSYLGRDPAAVAALVSLADLLAIPVLESVPNHVNFPASHPLHCGYQWTTSRQNPLLAQADVVLSVDSDVPWIHTTSRPSPAAATYCIDAAPLKSGMPMWHTPARRFAAANSRLALGQLTRFLTDSSLVDEAAVISRRAEISAVHEQ